MKRLSIAAAMLAIVPASAEAGTVAREGTELVYRSAPGERDYVVMQVLRGQPGISAGGTGVTLGAGCQDRTCSLDGVTAIRVLAGDGDDQVDIFAPLPVVADLGPGDDAFLGRARTVTASGGDGDDRLSFTAGQGALDGGPGSDQVRFERLGAGSTSGSATIAGGEGDDELTAEGRAKGSVDVACGPGADRLRLTLQDRAGEGCAPHVGVTTTFRTRLDAVLSGPGSLAAAFWRDGRVTARGAATAAAAGPLRVRMRPTRAGRGERSRSVFVELRTRFGGDRNAYQLETRFAR
ncbi:hypothetical protein DVA67_001890 [Solirubrobacter sp. CPCC 204708]|uniref:Calcium-binding protein n=1 Tax=Solirubrobacter deserti TaxID=2282478 RepID=A0ABT4RR21_9ACTN|nr:hypothetical protein [Solirubrobacter deserti]MBE2314709.1 hypothetical protein [Solirubrobacter deserti]MDA0141026.1 hypothetical protein [Solirubrobacter deserti]